MAQWNRGALCGALLLALVACDKDNNRNQSIYGGQPLPPGPNQPEGTGPVTGGPMVPAPISMPGAATPGGAYPGVPGGAVAPGPGATYPAPGGVPGNGVPGNPGGNPGLTNPLLPADGGNPGGIPDYGLTNPGSGIPNGTTGPAIGPSNPGLGNPGLGNPGLGNPGVAGPSVQQPIAMPAAPAVANPGINDLTPYFQGLRCPQRRVVIYDQRGAYDEARWCVHNRINFTTYHSTLTYFHGVRYAYGSRIVYGYPGQNSVVITRQIIQRYPDFNPARFDPYYRRCLGRGIAPDRAVWVAISEMYGR